MIYRKPVKEDGANMLQYLKRVGGESDNLHLALKEFLLQ